MAALLERPGVLASFGGQLHLADSAVERAARDVRSELLPDDGVPSPDGTPDDSELQWPGTELVRSDLFTDVRQVRFERRLEMTAEEYVGHLSTISAYLQLPEGTRDLVLARTLAVLPHRVTLDGDLTLHLARPVGDATTRTMSVSSVR